MQLCDLPNDVLAHVVRVSRIDMDSYKDFRYNLPLLAISRRLRYLALPFVYRNAYLRCFEGSPVDSTGESSSAIDTSLSLIADVGCVGLVRAVSVDVYRRAETPWALLRAAQVIRHSANIWPRVESLSINAMAATIDDGDIAGASTHDGDDARSAARALSSLFPRVGKLSFYGVDDGNMIGLYYGQLARHYAEQLEELRHEYYTPLPRDIYFQRLKRLYFTCGATSDYAFPRINPATLEEMCIYEAPASLNLDVFGASDDTPDIVFPKLRKLQLLYRDSTSSTSSMQIARQSGRMWRLYLPQVRSIHLRCDQTRCPFIENAVLPAAVESFQIKGNAMLLTAVAAKSLPTTQFLRLEVVKSQDKPLSVFAAINTIMSSMRPCQKAALTIADGKLPVLPENITFSGLTHLFIVSPTSMRTIIELIQRLRQLEFLRIFYYNIGDTPPEIAVPAPNKPELLPPFDSRIETLWISRSRGGGCEKRHIERVWQYLLLRMPSLKRARLGNVSRKLLARFVDNYSQRYPHLSSIQYSS